MTYELAKELRDAGFSQELPDPSSYYNSKGMLFGWSEGEDKPYHEYTKRPTLSELIEACGRIGFSLREKDKNTWQAKGGDFIDYSEGSTPEIAVAHLWLALNKPAVQ